MVFFTCDACGESLKKAAVEKHYQFQCRKCSVLSCVDCGKDFFGDEYKEHTKCISEEEKYSGKNYKPKPGANKGEVKQEMWTNQVQAAINKCKADPKLRNVLERLKDYPNIPRKKVKFENFVKNSLGIRDGSIATKTWDLIAAELPPPTSAPNQVAQNNNSEKPAVETEEKSDTQENGDGSEEKKLSKRERKEERKRQQNKGEKKDKNRKRTLENEEAEKVEEPKKKKKRKQEEMVEEETCTKESKKKKKRSKEVKEVEDVEENGEEENGEEEEEAEAPAGKFSWEAAIIGCLKRADDNELSLKKLRKKVLSEYAARGGDAKMKSETDLLAKFNKKVNKNPRLRSSKDKVKLLS